MGADHRRAHAGRHHRGWQVNGERSRPHSIMVNKKGQRFANEAANYNALGAAFHVLDVTDFDYVNHPAWLVFDDFYLRATASPAQVRRRRAHPGLDRRGPDARATWPTASVSRRTPSRRPSRGGTTPRRGGATPTSAGARAPHDRWWGDPLR